MHTATPLSVPPRRLKTLVRASGDLACSDFAPLACPRPASLSGRPLFKGRTDTQGLPSPCLRGTSPGAASAFGLPLRPALALSRFRTPHEAPLTGQDASRIREVWGTGITIPQDLMLMNEKIRHDAGERRVTRSPDGVQRNPGFCIACQKPGLRYAPSGLRLLNLWLREHLRRNRKGVDFPLLGLPIQRAAKRSRASRSRSRSEVDRPALADYKPALAGPWAPAAPR